MDTSSMIAQSVSKDASMVGVREEAVDRKHRDKVFLTNYRATILQRFGRFGWREEKSRKLPCYCHLAPLDGHPSELTTTFPTLGCPVHLQPSPLSTTTSTKKHQSQWENGLSLSRRVNLRAVARYFDVTSRQLEQDHRVL